MQIRQSNKTLRQSIRQFKPKLTSSGLLLAFSGILLSTSTPSRAIELKDAIGLAMDSHPEIISKKSQAESAQQTSVGAAWQLGPSLSLSTGKDTYGNSTSTTRIQQPLFTGGRIWHGIKEAQAKRDSAEAEFSATEQNIIGKVADSYLECIRLQERRKTAESNLREHKRLHALIQRRTEAGISSQNDVVTADMRLQQALAEFEAIKSQESTALQTLARLINTEVRAILPLQHPKLTQKVPFKTLEEAIQTSLGFSPEMVAARFKYDAAQSRSAIERSALLPQVYLRHEKYNRQNPTGSYPESQTFIALEYQLGTGVSSAYAWSASINQSKSAEASIDSTEKELVNTLTKYWYQYNLGLTQMVYMEKQLEASQSVVDSFARQYTVGKKTWLDVLNAQKEMTQSMNVVIDTKMSLMQAQIHIGIMTGTLTKENLETLK